MTRQITEEIRSRLTDLIRPGLVSGLRNAAAAPSESLLRALMLVEAATR